MVIRFLVDTGANVNCVTDKTNLSAIKRNDEIHGVTGPMDSVTGQAVPMDKYLEISVRNP